MSTTTVPIEVSARHVHLTADDWQTLFGQVKPTIAKMISQAPQFLVRQRLTLGGPVGQISDIGIIGPWRPYTQVELAQTDARRLGIELPLADSGHLEQAAEVTLTGPAGSITRRAAIRQQRHLHASPVEAERYGLTDGQLVSVRVDGRSGGAWDNVLVRIHPTYAWRMHIDTDEGNAFGLTADAVGHVIIPKA